MEINESIAVRIRRIGNGYLVHEERHAAQGYKVAVSNEVFHTDLHTVEQALPTRFQAALALDITNATEENF